jgi:hypothetical protein
MTQKPARRDTEVKVRLSQQEIERIDTERKAVGTATRGRFLRERVLDGTSESRTQAHDIADRLGRLGIAVNQLGPGSSAGARALAKEVRELTAAIRQWSEG